MRIVLLGTGNLATRLGITLKAKEAGVIQVYGRTDSNAKQLAGYLECPCTSIISEVVADADLYILAVAEEAIADLCSQLKIGNSLVVHTAGSVSMEVLAPSATNFGVLYPLQTFSSKREIDFTLVPICIEANSQVNLEILEKFASLFSQRVVKIDSDQRAELHLAAVFVCNFVNHFYSIGQKLLSEKELDFGLLHPLILETAEKVMHFSPVEVQTGPAVRGNSTILRKHQLMLKQFPEWEKLYQFVSSDIQSTLQ